MIVREIANASGDQKSADDLKKYLSQDQVRKRLSQNLTHLTNLDADNPTQQKLVKLFQYDLTAIYKGIDSSPVLQKQFQDSVYNIYKQRLALFSLINSSVNNFKKEHDGYLPGDSKECTLSQVASNQNGSIDGEENAHFWSCLRESGAIGKDFDENDVLKKSYDDLVQKIPQDLMKYAPQPPKITFVVGNYSVGDRKGNAVMIPSVPVFYAKVLNPQINVGKILSVNDKESQCIKGEYYGDDKNLCVIYNWID